jgi:curved DNA-binding protein
MPKTQDYYQLLGVDRSASEEDIRRAYRKLARELHPDVNKAPDAAERFARVTEAYDVLCDKEKRQAYDLHGERPPWAAAGRGPGGPGGGGSGRPGPGFTEPDLGSIFEELFGRGGPGGPGARGPGGPGGAGGAGGDPFARAARHRGQPQRGADREVDLAISFMTAARGGSERLRIRQEDGRERTIDVRIPAGVQSGARLRVAGEGLPGPYGGSSGDLIVRIEIGQHPTFRREGLDLITDITVTFPQAALGAEVAVPLLDGSATLRIPAGTSSGRRLRLRGRGIAADDGRTGDLLAAVRIDVPSSLDEPTRALIEQLAEHLPPAAASSPGAAPRSGAEDR